MRSPLTLTFHFPYQVNWHWHASQRDAPTGATPLNLGGSLGAGQAAPTMEATADSSLARK